MTDLDMTLDVVAERFKRAAPAADFWSLRLVDERYEGLSVRQQVVQPPDNQHNRGA